MATGMPVRRTRCPGFSSAGLAGHSLSSTCVEVQAFSLLPDLCAKFRPLLRVVLVRPGRIRRDRAARGWASPCVAHATAAQGVDRGRWSARPYSASIFLHRDSENRLLALV